MTTTQELLKSSFELNLNNYGPEDVERLNDWAINAYAALETLQAEVVRLRVIAKEASEYATKHQTEVLRLQAQLAAAQGQLKQLPVQPVQGLQSVADALTIEQLNDKVERLMAVQPSQAGDAQDAARYRWLRSTTNWASNSSNERIDVRNSPELWDAAIDAAINAKGNT